MNTTLRDVEVGQVVLIGHNRRYAIGDTAYRMGNRRTAHGHKEQPDATERLSNPFLNSRPTLFAVTWVNDEWRGTQLAPRLLEKLWETEVTVLD